MKKRQAIFLIAVLQLAAGPLAAQPEDIGLLPDVKASRILLVEEATGTVLIARRPDEPFAPGSLAKIMTVETVLDALARNEATPQTVFPVSEFAWRTGGAPSRTTTMFAALRTGISIRDLLAGVIVQNANDGCIVLAEGLAGSEPAFAARMNARAATLGLSGSVFGNATGLPTAESRVTARDLVRLAQHVTTTYPAYFALYSQADFEWNRIRQRNKNPLLGVVAGVDGFAAGFAEGAGYGLVATARRGETRLYLAISGLATEKDRLDETARIVNWGFDGFTRMTALAAGAIAGQAKVYGGTAETVPLAPLEAVEVYVPTAEAARLSAEIVYHGPLRAPVAKGVEAGRIRIMAGGAVLREVPLFTAGTVDEGTLYSRSGQALWALLFGWL